MIRISSIPRRLFLLLLIIAMIVAALAVAYIVRKQKIEQQILVNRDTGMAAFEQADYGQSLEALGTYLRRHPDDSEALLAYARSREQITLARSQHIPQAIGIYRRVLELDPASEEVRRDLLRLYKLVGYHTETVVIADEILGRHPTDLPSMLARCKALGALREYQKALTTAKKITTDHPDQLEGYLLVMQFMHELSQPVEAIIAFANGHAARHPDDVRFTLLQGVAHHQAGNLDQAKAYLKQAAQKPLDNLEFYRVLVEQIDLIGQYEISTHVLASAVKSSGSIEYRKLYATRLWQGGGAKQLAELLQNVTPDDPEADSQLLVFKALALNQPETVAQARIIVDALARRPKTDAVAAAWVDLFEQVLFVSSPDARAVIEATEAALVRLPGEPHILFLRGTAHLSVGETLRAVSYWQQASRAAPAWPLPRVRLARGLIQLGRNQDAIRAAIDALLRSPGSLQASVALAIAWHSIDPESTRLLGLVEHIQLEVKGEEDTLPIYISLLVRHGKVEQAKQKLMQIAAEEITVSQPTMLRLATLSDELKLDMASRLLDRIRQTHGISPPVSLYLAQRLRRSAGDVEALALFQKDWDAAQAGKENVGWRVTWATLLSEIDVVRARQEWISVADAAPDNLQIQRMAGDAAAVQQDREFLDRVIERIRKQSGNEGTDWRMKRVRWLLSRDNDKETAAQAALLLREVLAVTFDDLNARRQLALCFQRLNNLPAAIDELQTAFKLHPYRADLALDLAGLLQSAGDFVKSRDLIDHVLDQQELSRRQRQQAAHLLATQGATDIAIATLEDQRNLGAEEVPGEASDILLARLYWLRKEPDKARPLFDALLAPKSDPDAKPNPLVIQMAANFYEDQGEHENAAATLTLLDKLTELPPGVRELLLAEHHSRATNKSKAAHYFEAAIAAAPDNVSIWQLYAAHQLRQGNLDQAVITIETAIKRLPDAAGLAFVREHLPLIKQSLALDMNRLEPMVYAMITDSQHQAVAAQILQVIVTSAGSGVGIDSLMAQLRRLADQTPRFLELQNLVASTYMILNRPDEAARISMRAMETFPTAPAPAAMHAAALALGKRWREVIPAADAWLQRSAGDIVRVDLLRSQALINLDKAPEAVSLLAPHYAQALAASTPQVSAKQLTDVAPFYLRGLIAAKNEPEAADLIMQLVTRDPKWAAPLLQISFEQKASHDWLGKLLINLQDVIPSDMVEGRLSLSLAHLTLAREGAAATHLKQGQALIDDLIARKLSSANVHYVSAQLHEAQGQLDLAEAAYRQVLLAAPQNPAAKNNLAMLLLRRPQAVEEAVALAAAAVRLVPQSANLRDTLASAYMAAGKPASAAVELHEAVRLEPKEVKWQVRLVWALLESNEMEKARALFKPLRESAPTRPWPPEIRQRIEQIEKRLG